LRWMLGGVVEDHPNGTFTYLWGMLTGSAHESHPLSEWPSDKPGTIHIAPASFLGRKKPRVSIQSEAPRPCVFFQTCESAC
jgi:hypothetical protein